MNTAKSLVQYLSQSWPQLRSQIYFKSSLTALSRALEDLVLTGAEQPLVIANFQRERYYHQENQRYHRISQQTDQVYILAAPEPESAFAVDNASYETIPLGDDDHLTQEWHLIILCQRYAAGLFCQELPPLDAAVGLTRRFQGFWGFDRPLIEQAADWLLATVVQYRPELAVKVAQAKQDYLTTPNPNPAQRFSPQINSDIFGQRLMTHLQASQYRLLKAYRVIDAQARKEQLLNTMTAAMRRSLEPEVILETAVQELGHVFDRCRCLLYRCSAHDTQVTFVHEAGAPNLPSLKGQGWSISTNPVLEVARLQERATAIADLTSCGLAQPTFKATLRNLKIQAWLLVPIRHQGQLLGMVELHSPSPYRWRETDTSMVEVLATQIGVALTQADAYVTATTLNQKLWALEKTQSNLINIVGHELRTPLSTIQVCLESLESDHSMPRHLRQVMLDAAMTDANRMNCLIQDFLTLSRLESQQVYLCPEMVQFQEALDMALSGFKTRDTELIIDLPDVLPLLQVDGSALVDVLTRLLDNAHKFTPITGKITIQAKFLPVDLQSNHGTQPMLEVSITDTGCGIELGQLDTIFDSFYQVEDYLRRTVGGVGLGLAICRLMVQAMNGKIWAESAGHDQGSRFFFTVPTELSPELTQLQLKSNG